MTDNKSDEKPAAAKSGQHFTETAEFKSAVADAVSAAVQSALAQMVPAIAQSTQSDNGAFELMNQLALRIAQLSDQGMPEERKRIDPAELERREAARRAMGEAIMECRVRGYKPQWRATNKSVLNEVMINPYVRAGDGKMVPVTFGWDGEPNDCMYPLCEDATKIFKLFKESRGAYQGAPTPKTAPWASAGGVIINSAGPRSAGTIDVPVFGEDGTAKARFAEGLDMALPNDPNATHVNVLGTIAKPAVQNYAGEEAKK